MKDPDILKIIENNKETLSLLRKKLIENGIKEPEKDIIYEMFKNACYLLKFELEEIEYSTSTKVKNI